MKKSVMVAPSILSADFSRLGREIKDIEAAGADWVHIDVMDGAFVPNITIGPLVVRSIRPVSKLFFDVHLMINDPGKYVGDFADAGSDLITFHAEAVDDPAGIIGKIRQKGKKAGISVKPGTDISRVKGLLPELDLVLVMTVEPGFGGQAFMPEMLDKVKEIRGCFDGYIQVDGGINVDTARQAVDAGVDVLVAGTAVFGKSDYKMAIEALKGK
ncbi:MAG: ribulose-phosphate 3-epimerase [Candidatus Omnitrophica bacterium]|nr:ribulose-phosphate 3-epimerase [Candidatus Omnitrophota bacterium]MDD5487459.1 ribulose-phosphate 3-epimerase [Candidatus Omnitrophota bacterium]